MAQLGVIATIPTPTGPNQINWRYDLSLNATSDFMWPTAALTPTLPVRFEGAHGVLGGSGTFYLMFFDSATVPQNGARPNAGIVLIYAPASWSLNALGRPMTNGISWALSTTQLTLTLATAQDINVLATWRQA